MVHAVDDEVIDEAEDESARHGGRDHPATEPRAPPPETEADERRRKNHDEHEQPAEERQRHLCAGVRAPVRDVEPEMDEHDASEGLSSRHEGKTMAGRPL